MNMDCSYVQQRWHLSFLLLLLLHGGGLSRVDAACHGGTVLVPLMSALPAPEALNISFHHLEILSLFSPAELQKKSMATRQSATLALSSGFSTHKRRFAICSANSRGGFFAFMHHIIQCSRRTIIKKRKREYENGTKTRSETKT